MHLMHPPEAISPFYLRRGFIVLFVCLGTVGGLALRSINSAESLWVDELVTSWIVSEGAEAIRPRALLTNCPPTYFYLVWLSQKVLGAAEWSFRLPSLVAGTLLIPLAYIAARRVSSSTTVGLVAVTLVATDGLCIQYSATARIYSLIQLVSLLHAISFWCACERPGWTTRAMFVATLALLFHLHVTGVLIVLGEIAFFIALWNREETPMYRWWQFAMDLVAAAVLALPVLPVVTQASSGRHELGLLEQVRLEDLLTVFPLPVYVILPLVATLIIGYLFKSPVVSLRADAAESRGFPFWVYLYFIPIFAVWLATRAGVVALFHNRYLLSAYQPLLLGCAALAQLLPAQLMRIVFLSTVVLLAQVTEGPVRRLLSRSPFPRHTVEDWKAAIGFLNRHDTDPAWPVLIRAGFLGTESALGAAAHMRPTEVLALQEALTVPVRTIYALLNTERTIESLRFDGSFADDGQFEAVQRGGGAWFLIKGHPRLANTLIQKIEAELKQKQRKITVEDRLDSTNVTVFKLRIHPAD